MPDAATPRPYTMLQTRVFRWDLMATSDNDAASQVLAGAEPASIETISATVKLTPTPKATPAMVKQTDVANLAAAQKLAAQANAAPTPAPAVSATPAAPAPVQAEPTPATAQ